MGQALYRKYRSKSLDEVVGQEHITTTLENALKRGAVSHAYLFTGPRGVGKTSIARILAHAVNNLPYNNVSGSHLDIIEIDAASNRRIDEIRELRERIHNAPAAARYKVYIIDEVHMLTREAFNALLKTLEEPPAHVIFILATTESHKLPETIISRAQRFTFKPIEAKKAVRHLASIAKSEGIDISQEALELIAKHGDGSFRDSISLLDQASAAGKQIGLSDIQSMLGIAPAEALNALLTAVDAGQTGRIVSLLSDLREQGLQAAMVAKQLGGELRRCLLGERSAPDANLASKLLRELVEVPVSHDPESLLEIILLEAAITRAPANRPAPNPEPATPTKTPSQPKPAKETKPKKSAAAALAPAVKKPTAGTNIDGVLTPETWQDVLAAIKARHNTLYSLARMASPRFDNGRVILRFAFPFHQKRLKEAKNKQIIIKVIRDLTGQDLDIACELLPADKAAQASPEPTPPAKGQLENISNIFGGAEVLE